MDAENQKNNIKREKFVVLAERRTEKALQAIRSLSPLSNKANYEYSNKDFIRIRTALKDAIKELEEAFSSKHASKRERFKLDE